MVAPNNRVFYACEAVAIGKVGSPSNENQHFPLEFVHGVQSVGFNSSFNVEEVFELGQFSVYENIEGLAELEMTIEKLIDGSPLVYHMATSGASSYELLSRLKRKCNIAMAIGSDENSAISGGPGLPSVEIFMSGMFVNGLSYTFPADGASTESVTLTGNNKVWNSVTPFMDPVNGLQAGPMFGWNQAAVNTILPQGFSRFNQDYPVGSGGVSRREDVLMESSIMPCSIFGVNGVAVGNNYDNVSNKPRAHISSISISVGGGIDREDILELGQKEPYYKSISGPMEVTSEFEVTTVSGDFVGFYNSRPSTPEQKIRIALRNGMSFDLGSKNRLNSVNYGGGEAGGGNLTITYSFQTSNDLIVTEPTRFDPPRVEPPL
jgi:hypothetical protein